MGLRKQLSHSSTKSSRKNSSHFPQDGGYGWIILLACFLTCFICDGIQFSFGILFNHLSDTFSTGKAGTAIAASVHSGGRTIMGGILCAVLIPKFGARIVGVVAALIMTVGVVASSFSPNIQIFVITYGIISGGASGLLLLCPTISLNYWFCKRRAIANCVSATGFGFGMMIVPMTMNTLILAWDWRNAFCLAAGFCLHGVVFCCLLRPKPPERSDSKVRKGNAQKPKRLKRDRPASQQDSEQNAEPVVLQLRKTPKKSLYAPNNNLCSGNSFRRTPENSSVLDPIHEDSAEFSIRQSGTVEIASNLRSADRRRTSWIQHRRSLRSRFQKSNAPQLSDIPSAATNDDVVDDIESLKEAVPSHNFPDNDAAANENNESDNLNHERQPSTKSIKSRSLQEEPVVSRLSVDESKAVRRVKSLSNRVLRRQSAVDFDNQLETLQEISFSTSRDIDEPDQAALSRSVKSIKNNPIPTSAIKLCPSSERNDKIEKPGSPVEQAPLCNHVHAQVVKYGTSNDSVDLDNEVATITEKSRGLKDAIISAYREFSSDYNFYEPMRRYELMEKLSCLQDEPERLATLAHVESLSDVSEHSTDSTSPESDSEHSSSSESKTISLCSSSIDSNLTSLAYHTRQPVSYSDDCDVLSTGSDLNWNCRRRIARIGSQCESLTPHIGSTNLIDIRSDSKCSSSGVSDCSKRLNTGRKMLSMTKSLSLETTDDTSCVPDVGLCKICEPVNENSCLTVASSDAARVTFVSKLQNVYIDPIESEETSFENESPCRDGPSADLSRRTTGRPKRPVVQSSPGLVLTDNQPYMSSRLAMDDEKSRSYQQLYKSTRNSLSVESNMLTPQRQSVCMGEVFIDFNRGESMVLSDELKDEINTRIHRMPSRFKKKRPSFKQKGLAMRTASLIPELYTQHRKTVIDELIEQREHSHLMTMDIFYPGSLDQLSDEPIFQRKHRMSLSRVRTKFGIDDDEETWKNFTNDDGQPKLSRRARTIRRVKKELKKKEGQVLDSLKIFLDPAILKDKVFLLIAVANFLIFSVISSNIVYINNLLSSIDGVNGTKYASNIIACAGISGNVGRLLTTIINLFKKIRYLPYIISMLSIAALSMLLTPACTNIVLAGICISTYWFCMGIFNPMMNCLLAETFGLKKLTNCVGILMVVRGLGSLMGPPLAGFVADHSGFMLAPFVMVGCVVILANIWMFIAYVTIRQRKRRLNYGLAGMMDKVVQHVNNFSEVWVRSQRPSFQFGLEAW